MLAEKAAQVLDYSFRDEQLLVEALTHASSAGHRLESNERMEFLGDAILGVVVCEYLFRHYPDLLEGELTKMKSAVVSRRVCAEISQKLDLESLLTVGRGMSGRPALPSSVLAGVFESLIAAIYLDGDMPAARTFILEHVTPYIKDAAESAHHQNFKSVLQQFAQRRLPNNPAYILMDEKGPDHSKCFEVCVEIDGHRFKSCWANSKKEAEQKAALEALVELKIASIDDRGLVTIGDITQGEPGAS